MTHEECLKLFSYDKESGKLYWKIKPNDRTHVGTECGHIMNCGYKHISYKGKKYLAHRLIWFIQNAVWPEKQLDHINGLKLDNRLENLREVTNRMNANNLKQHRQGHLVGSSFDKRRNKWQSYIKLDKVRKHLGYFQTQLEAHSTYINKCKELGFL